MKVVQTLLFISFILVNTLAQAQSKEAALLTGKVWVLESDEMSGLGTHLSLTDNTKLEFTADGMWKSSEPIKGVKQGKWTLMNNNRTLVMTFQNEEISYLILELSEKTLQYRLKKNATTFTYQWVVK
jgi:hypothetical protein